MNNNGIKSRPIWNHMHKIKYLKKYNHGDLSNSIRLEKLLICQRIGLIYDK